MEEDHTLREHLCNLLSWSDAHVSVEQAIEEMPAEARGTRAEGLPFSVWELLEHIRIAQDDILSFCVDDEYEHRDWPGDYWPDEFESDTGAWDTTVESVREGQHKLKQVAMDTRRDLFAPLPNGDGQTLLRELLLVADHTAYHVGQIVQVRRALGVWKDGSSSANG